MNGIDKKSNPIILAAFLCLLQACGAPVKDSGSPQIDDQSSVADQSSSSGADPSADAASANSDQAAVPEKRKPAVGAPAMELLVLARDQAAQGHGELASSTLERAISIEPENPCLWHRLAVLRMQLKHWSQAVELANRSIALANNNKRLIGGNWLVISLALEGAGDLEAARKAKKNSDTYLGKEKK